MKKALYLIIPLLLFTATTQAQNTLIDSLKTELTKAKQDTNRVNILNDLSRQNSRIANYDTALHYAAQAKALAEKLGFKKGTGNAYNNIGIVYDYQSNYPEALENYFTSLKIREEIGDKQGIAGSYNNIGLIYASQGNYPEALKNYFAALKINEETANKSWIAINYNNIGNVYSYQGNYPEALEKYFAALKIYEEIGDKQGIAGSYTNIGMVYSDQGNYPEALENYFASLKISEEIGDKYGIASSYNNIGNVYSYQGNYPEALKQYLASLKIREEIGDKWGIAGSYINIGSVYTKLNQAAEGKVWLQKGLALSRGIGAKELIKGSYSGLALADSALSNFKGAFENHKMYIIYKDSIFNEENTKKLTQTEMQYEFDKKEALAQAEQEKKDILSREQLAKAKNNRNLAIAGVGIVMIVAVFLGIGYNRKKKSNKIISEEKQKSDNLLLNILPEEVAEELKAKGSAEAKQFDEVSILFTDFVHFTQTSEKLSPQELVQELNECFTAFDNIMERNGLEKIKTIGDAYLAVCGLPASDPLHARKTVQAAIEIKDFVEKRKQGANVIASVTKQSDNEGLLRAARNDAHFDIRIGIHSGSVVAGIVGVKKFAYDIWGDTVNTAARMEQSGEPGKVNISETTYELVKENFTCAYRGEVEAKGKGKMKMYFVE